MSRSLLPCFLVCLLSSLPVLEACSRDSIMADKDKWPELVGKTGEEAKAAILVDRPGLDVQIIGDNMMMTMDFRTDRVRIRVDSDGKVSSPPSVG